MRKTVRQLLFIAVALGIGAALLLAGAYLATQRAPAFYRRALAAPQDEQQINGQHFERSALALHNQIYEAGRWQTCLTQDEINGWLATDLPEKFPKALPPGISEPRIAIENETVHLAVRYRRSGVDTVLSISGEAYLTAQPNEIAVRLDRARAGLLPVPLARFLNEITARAAKAEVPLRWTEVRGAPVALLRLPLDQDEEGCRVVLEDIRWRNGQLVVAGRTEEPLLPTEKDEQPTTAVQPGDKETRQR
jgi:hypothetical protein